MTLPLLAPNRSGSHHGRPEIRQWLAETFAILDVSETSPRDVDAMDALREWFQDAVFGNGLIAFLVLGLTAAVVLVARILRPGRL